jgi:hypothetical protein
VRLDSTDGHALEGAATTSGASANTARVAITSRARAVANLGDLVVMP